MKIIREIIGAFKDIPKVGFTTAMGGLIKYSTIPCWLKEHLICNRVGHKSDGYYCFRCWREE